MAPNSASAATMLITCTDLVQAKTAVLKIDKKSCKSFSPSAIWHLQLTDSADHSGAGFATLRICSSKNPYFTYQKISVECPRFLVTTDYWRAISAPQTPNIATATARGHDSAVITFEPSETVTRLDAPIAYYLVTDAKSGLTTRFLPGSAGHLHITGLSSESTYTFIIAAVSVDGTSAISQLTPTLKTGIAPIVATVSTTALSCARGGTCIVGDRGPGGGIVFYVSAAPFTSAGSTCDTACKYLEVAPATWQSAGVSVANDLKYQWATSYDTPTSQDTVTVGIESGFANERFNWKIGQGFYNTSTMRVSGETTTAQAKVLGYAGGSAAGQWFIPSMNELNELCKYARGQTTGVLTVVCADTDTLKTGTTNDLGGFMGDYYWSSSDVRLQYAWNRSLGDGIKRASAKKLLLYVRPIRAF